VVEVPEVDRLREVGLAAGLDAVEVTDTSPFPSVLADLLERRNAGLHAGMGFTYRNPQRSTTPAGALPEARSLVVGARGYLTDDGTRPADGPVGHVARYAREDHYAALRAGLTAIGRELKAAGWRARVLADDNALVDRAAAHRAGLGWWGKNANLLLPGAGSWFVLGSVLTDAPLPMSTRQVEDRCGSCTRCLTACPTAAITAPGVVDARRCLSWLLQAEGMFPREHRVALGDRIYGCDDCQEVCPPNRRMRVRVRSSAHREWVPLLQLLDPDDAVVLRWAERWYIPKREVRYVRRNALVVLANVGPGRDPAVGEVLERHLRHEDPLLRAHAVWAARRLGREDLLEPVRDDPDPWVRAELDAPA
jgi:epoxyqueuosine reductase